MKKKLLSTLLVLALVLSIFTFASKEAQAMRFYGSYIYNCKSAALKSSASGSSNTICKIPYGKSVTWNYGIDRKNGYYSVSYNGHDGWVRSKYCTWDDYGATRYPCKVSKRITLRKKKSSSSSKVTKIPKGAIVFTKTTELNGKKWVYVYYKNKKGYVLSKYLKYI